MFIDVKSIQSVVTMIPHVPLVDGQQESEHFFLVEKLGFDVTVMVGVEEEFIEEGTGILNGDRIASTMA